MPWLSFSAYWLNRERTIIISYAMDWILMKSRSKTFILVQLHLKNTAVFCYSLHFLPIEYFNILSLKYLFCDVFSLWNVSLLILYISFITSEHFVLSFLSPWLWVSKEKTDSSFIQYVLFYILLHFNYFHSSASIICTKMYFNDLNRFIWLFAILHLNIKS